MRDLDATNPELLRPSKFATISACILLLFSLVSVPLADGAAPNVAVSENPIVVLIGSILMGSVILALVSVIFRWDWKAKYYGVVLLSVVGISFMAVVPCLAALLYGGAPFVVRAMIVTIYGLSHYFWCRKFHMLYQIIFNDESLRGVIFEEEADAVYYMRRGDNFLLEKHFEFSQIPRDRYFALFVFVACLLVPVMGAAKAFMGVPFVHIFLIVAMLPVSWMSIGLAFKAYLVFYFYPSKIRKATGKEIYVDLASKHRPLEKRLHRKSSRGSLS